MKKLHPLELFIVTPAGSGPTWFRLKPDVLADPRVSFWRTGDVVLKLKTISCEVSSYKGLTQYFILFFNVSTGEFCWILEFIDVLESQRLKRI